MTFMESELTERYQAAVLVLNVTVRAAEKPHATYVQTDVH